ncbi:hypothetical protein TI04_08140 [Achromatium sp. WMS2]|nr:hypothetical protein TI04_08140 [Achromatium sp. WMS2]
MKIRQIAALEPDNDWFVTADRGTYLAKTIYYSSFYLKWQLIGFDPLRPERYTFLHKPNGYYRGRNAIIIAQDQTAVNNIFGNFFQDLHYIGEYSPKYRNIDVKKSKISLFIGLNFQEPTPVAK